MHHPEMALVGEEIAASTSMWRRPPSVYARHEQGSVMTNDRETMGADNLEGGAAVAMALARALDRADACGRPPEGSERRVGREMVLDVIAGVASDPFWMPDVSVMPSHLEATQEAARIIAASMMDSDGEVGSVFRLDRGAGRIARHNIVTMSSTS